MLEQSDRKGQMEEFSGRVRLLGDADEIAAAASLPNGQLRLMAGSTAIGKWDLAEIEVESLDDGFHIRVEDGELVFVADAERAFANALKGAQANTRKRSRARVKANVHPAAREEEPAARAEEKGPRARAEGFLEEWRQVPLLWRAGVVVALLLLVLGLFWRVFVVVPLVIIAATSLLAGVVTAVDPFIAVRLPSRLSPAILLWVGGSLGGLILALAVFT